MSDPAAETEASTATGRWRIVTLASLAVVGIGVLIALVLIQGRTDRERDRALALQSHTYQVLLRANQLSTAITGAEAALGRYVVSADKALGREFSAEWAKASDQLDRIAQLTRDNPVQQKQIADFRKAFVARGKELSGTALYSVYDRDRDAWGAYYQVRDSEARRALEAGLERIMALERELLRERTANTRVVLEESNLAARVLVAFGMLIVLGAILLGWYAIQAEGERSAADADAEAERVRAAELQEAVTAATAQLREEIRERTEAEAQLRQVQKMEAVGQLTGGIAHDFNNMLAVVLGGLELAKRHLHKGGPHVERHIENAMEGANRAAALTRRLLAFSRSEPLLPAAVEAGAVIDGMADLFDRTLGDGIAVETGDAGLGWQVWVDRHQLENALLNLAVNARDAMEGRGSLTVVTGGRTLAEGEIGESAAGEFVSIAVTDTGAGMTPEVLERVFEPFFTTKPVGKGTGLGLSQIFGFVRQSDGEIDIATAPDQGTTVTLYLPRYTGEAVPADDADAPLEAPVDGSGLDILIVEDDPRVLAATMEALGELGHRVTGCGDPREVPATLDALESLDLIVSDVLMPGQTGPEMIAALGERIAGVGVLYVTGYAGEADAEAFGDHPVLRKPFTMAALSRAVAEAASRR